MGVGWVENVVQRGSKHRLPLPEICCSKGSTALSSAEKDKRPGLRVRFRGSELLSSRPTKSSSPHPYRCPKMSPTSSTLDHEKPEAVYPQVFEYVNTHSPVTPDIEYAPSIDEGHLEERIERRGESVW
jgi:hypothetical protein